MIFEMLEVGKENARTAKELAGLLGVDRRSISSIIERERRTGSPICATCNSRTPGYYVPENRAEMEDYCNQLRHRAGEIFKTRAACIATLSKLSEAE